MFTCICTSLGVLLTTVLPQRHRPVIKLIIGLHQASQWPSLLRMQSLLFW